MTDEQQHPTSRELPPTMDGDTVRLLAKRLNRDRLDRRMTWPAYARFLGVKHITVYRIATGRTVRPHQLTVDQILRTLDQNPIQEGMGTSAVVSDRIERAE